MGERPPRQTRPPFLTRGQTNMGPTAHASTVSRTGDLNTLQASPIRQASLLKMRNRVIAGTPASIEAEEMSEERIVAIWKDKVDIR